MQTPCQTRITGDYRLHLPQLSYQLRRDERIVGYEKEKIERTHHRPREPQILRTTTVIFKRSTEMRKFTNVINDENNTRIRKITKNIQNRIKFRKKKKLLKLIIFF